MFNMGMVFVIQYLMYFFCGECRRLYLQTNKVDDLKNVKEGSANYFFIILMNRTFRLFLFCSAFGILLLIYDVIYNTFSLYLSITIADVIKWSDPYFFFNDELPTIVGWTSFYYLNIKTGLEGTYYSCPYKCNMMNRNEFNRSTIVPSAYILHGPNMNSFDLPIRYPHQLIVFMSREPPSLSGNAYKQVSAGYFNATITYRSDATYYWPYGILSKRTQNDKSEEYYTDAEIESAIDQKTDGSLTFITHCKTESKREDYIMELAKYTNITIYGKCPFRTTSEYCPKKTKSCEDPIIAKHRFYLAFENSYCEEYVTEKFFVRLTSLIVPIVLKRKFYNPLSVPPGSFIAADDFSSPKELAQYLDYLSNNRTAYKKYFNWTHQYKKTISFGSSLCQLCTDLHLKRKRSVNDIVKYMEQKKCYKNEEFQ